MKQKPLSVTVGIPTCYGGLSLVNTVRSIRRSPGGKYIRIIVTADRTPITKEVKAALKKLNTDLYWNDKEGSQTKKIKQMVAKTTTDIYIATQDDITFDDHTISEIISAFEADPSLTMAGVRIRPLPPETFFESAMGSMVRIVDSIASSWNGTNNHLAPSGRCLAYRHKHQSKFRIPESVVNSDMFFYLENKRLGGTFRLIPTAYVSIRCPQEIKDQIAPSSRYLYSKEEMKGYFNQNLDSEYRIPWKYIISAYIRELALRPLPSLYYFLIRLYTLIKRLPRKTVANPVWRVDVSTKQGASSL